MFVRSSLSEFSIHKPKQFFQAASHRFLIFFSHWIFLPNGNEFRFVSEPLCSYDNSLCDVCQRFCFFCPGGISVPPASIGNLKNCRFYLQPSRYEGFGLAIAEAMSCGAVVITTDVGEVLNVVGDVGVIIKDTLPQTIANAIEEHWNDDLESISIAAHDRIESLFSMTRREKDIMNVVTKYKG